MNRASYTLHLDKPFGSLWVSEQTVQPDPTVPVSRSSLGPGCHYKSWHSLTPTALEQLSATATVQKDVGGVLQEKPAEIGLITLTVQTATQKRRLWPEELHPSSHHQYTQIHFDRNEHGQITDTGQQAFKAALLGLESQLDKHWHEYDISLPESIPSTVSNRSFDIPLHQFPGLPVDFSFFAQVSPQEMSIPKRPDTVNGPFA